ncbi:MAG TPA: hypothetical protein DCX32_04630 [Candidatus Moranbacteria bacterium]|nr:MAG: hypothetical protein UW87_C0001G0017 [Candidatus Moranbacteria bacterium GW2011_GWC2_45_10]KKT94951.1 MAG: sortase family protein [Parcubacteria group bacterium GW2011_GWC1_45_14]HAV11794.1 hypothetical protein [Candidatus Moranbacteria bacterium]
MLNVFPKSGYQLKKAVFFTGLFLAILLGIFYLVNFDLDFSQKESPQEKAIRELNLRDELKAEIGSGEIGLADFAQWAKVHALSGKDLYNSDSDGDGLSNYQEFVHLTDPNVADTDKDGYSDREEVANGYDPDASGDAKPLMEVSISKISVEAPMVWSKSESEKDMLRDLEDGLSHYPNSAAPGQSGNAVISGHSSNYVWAKGDYNHVFKNLNDLEIGDVVTVKATQKNGRTILYRFKVSEKFTTSADDERIFAQTKGSTLTLSTCWPLGTTLKRVIVKAEIVK